MVVQFYSGITPVEFEVADKRVCGHSLPSYMIIKDTLSQRGRRETDMMEQRQNARAGNMDNSEKTRRSAASFGSNPAGTFKHSQLITTSPPFPEDPPPSPIPTPTRSHSDPRRFPRTSMNLIKTPLKSPPQFSPPLERVLLSPCMARHCSPRFRTSCDVIHSAGRDFVIWKLLSNSTRLSHDCTDKVRAFIKQGVIVSWTANKGSRSLLRGGGTSRRRTPNHKNRSQSSTTGESWPGGIVDQFYNFIHVLSPGKLSSALPTAPTIANWVRFQQFPSPPSRIFARAGRCLWLAGFLRDLPFTPPFHSGATPYSSRFTLIVFQHLDVKSHPNIFIRFSTACSSRNSRLGKYRKHHVENCSPPGFSQMGIVPDDAAVRRVFSGSPSFPRPFIPALLHPQPRFAFIGFQDLDVKGRPNLFTHSLTGHVVAPGLSNRFFDISALHPSFSL
ncbi:hypothetical protein PR048_027442 [Dryococelus australis]|uniref:Uncharacterized protein n=1 Tax=Dryococelus australis TaxID=614101 RepID=A0ABQ9GGI4_9NEOP|nr:hypothetical protein PR048_027442 [Dryococelus australis]